MVQTLRVSKQWWLYKSTHGFNGAWNCRGTEGSNPFRNMVGIPVVQVKDLFHKWPFSMFSGQISLRDPPPGRLVADEVSPFFGEILRKLSALPGGFQEKSAVW